MVRKAIIAASLIALMSGPAIAQDADPMANVIWEFRTTTNSYFWVTAKDLTWQSGNEPITVWVRGDHYGDKTVKYRTSIYRMTFDCKGSVRTNAVSKYAADGQSIESWDGYGAAKYIRPDSMAANLQERFCGKK